MKKEVESVEDITRRMNLQPMRPLDVASTTTTSDLLAAMADTAFTGRTLGEAADVMQAMLSDPDCKVVMTLSGAMTMAGMRRLIIEMIELGDWLQPSSALTTQILAIGILVASAMAIYFALALATGAADRRLFLAVLKRKRPPPPPAAS